MEITEKVALALYRSDNHIIPWGHASNQRQRNIYKDRAVMLIEALAKVGLEVVDGEHGSSAKSQGQAASE